MRKNLLPVILSILVLVSLACQLPAIPTVEPTVEPGTPIPPTESPAALPSPTDTMTPEPTFTATVLPLTLTPDPVLDPSGLILETHYHLEESSLLPGYRIEDAFPVFVSPADDRLTRFNLEVEGLLNDLESSFRTDASAIVYDPNFGTNQSLLSSTYQVTYINRGVVSIRFTISQYMSGAAHPNSFSLVYNFDLLEGNQITLGELFLPGVDYLTPISDYCTSTLAADGRLEFPAGALPDEANYRNWNILPAGLQITFDPYQVGPYAMGPSTVVIPFSELTDILRLDGAIGRITQP